MPNSILMSLTQGLDMFNLSVLAVRRHLAMCGATVALLFFTNALAVGSFVVVLDVTHKGVSNIGDKDAAVLVNEMISPGVVLWFPPGKYRFESTVTIPAGVSGVAIYGVPGETIFLKDTIKGPLLRINGDANLVYGVTVDGQCRRENGCLADPKKGSNILVNGSRNTFLAIRSINGVSNGIHFDGQRSVCVDNTVLDSEIANNARVGVASAKCDRLSIVRSRLVDNGYEAITLDLSTSNTLVKDNTITNANLTGGIGAIGFDAMRNTVIVGNKFTCDGCKRAFIRAGNATGVSENAVIAWNYFKGNTSAIDLRGTVRSTGGNQRFVIYGNSYEDIPDNKRLLSDKDDQNIQVLDRGRNF